MKNYEKYLDKVIESASEGGMAVTKKGVVCRCADILCASCLFEGEEYQCNEKALEWLKEEYVEPEVDWSKVKVDTKVLVRNFEVEKWIPRYFAKYENGEVFVFVSGATSYTTGDVCTYRYVKLYEGEQE